METSIDLARQAWLKNKPDLVINRVPKDALDNFKSMAKDEFEDDYGMCLKWLMDLYVPKNFELEGRVMLLEEKLEKLEGHPKKTSIKLGTGKEILIDRK